MMYLDFIPRCDVICYLEGLEDLEDLDDVFG